MISLSSEVQHLFANRILSTYLNPRLRYLRLLPVWKKQTSAILKLFFRFQHRPYHSNRRAILHQTTKFRQNATRGGVMTSYTFSRWRPWLLHTTSGPYLMMSLSSVLQNLSTNQISLRYLDPRLRYNYFRFGKTRPPYCSSSSLCDFDQIAVICVVLWIKFPNFVQIGPPAAD